MAWFAAVVVVVVVDGGVGVGNFIFAVFHIIIIVFLIDDDSHC